MLSGLKLLKPKEIMGRLGCGKTKFWKTYVNTGKIQLTESGHCPEHEVDEVIREIIAARDAKESSITRSPKIAKMVNAKIAKRAAAVIAEQSKSSKSSSRRSSLGYHRSRRGTGGHPKNV
jgi:hypothetical protein